MSRYIAKPIYQKIKSQSDLLFVTGSNEQSVTPASEFACSGKRYTLLQEHIPEASPAAVLCKEHAILADAHPSCISGVVQGLHYPSARAGERM
jgi:hypothetical protein